MVGSRFKTFHTKHKVTHRVKMRTFCPSNNINNNNNNKITEKNININKNKRKEEKTKTTKCDTIDISTTVMNFNLQNEPTHANQRMNLVDASFHL